MPETSGRQFSQMAEMMAKIQNLEKDRDALLERNDIVGVLTKGQDQMHLLLSERSKRERTEKEAPEEAVLVKMEDFKYEDDNHTRLCWEAMRQYK